MALSINTNVESLNAQRNLFKSQNTLAQSLQRLSSGLRINSAKDDSAGLAISNRMTNQTRGMGQAVRNANDGVSMVQTAEGAMQEVTSLLGRMRELAVQAANDTYTDSDRASLQGEVDQLYAEIDRISDATEFNGIKLLDGTGGQRSFQVGANSGQIIAMSFDSVSTQALNLNGYSGLGELNGGRITDTAAAASQANGLRINGVAVNTTAGAEADDKRDVINQYTTQTGVSASAYNTVKGGTNETGVVSGLHIIVGGAATSATIAASGSMEELVDNINRDAYGITATLNSDGSLTLANDTGKEIAVVGTTTNSGLTTGTYHGFISLTDDDGDKIQITSGSTIAATATVELRKFGFNVTDGSDSLTSGSTSTTSLAETDLVSVNGVNLGKSIGSSAGAKAYAINQKTTDTGVSATASTVVRSTATTGSCAASDLSINGVAMAVTSNVNDLVTKINSANCGVNASTDENGLLVLTSNSGADVVLSGANIANAGLTAGTTTGTITLISESGADIKVKSSAATETNRVTALQKLGLTEFGGSEESVGAGLSVETRANASKAIEQIDTALDKVSAIRGDMGAIQNRLDSTVANLQNVSENISAANGRILDADFAYETANMTKTQILQQAGTAMLAQANQLPQAVLSLLG